MSKKKLFILAGPIDNQNAGVFRVTYELINGLHEMEDCPFDITLIREKTDDQFPKFKTKVIPSLKKIPGFQSFRLFFLVPLYCIFKQANIVFEPAHFGPFNLPSWIKRVTFIHDLTPIIFPEFHTFNGSVLQKLFLPRILKKTDLIICNSENTKQDLFKIYPFTKDKVESIYLGISEFFKYSNNRDALDNFKINHAYFLSVNTIEPRKNIVTLLKAFDIYKSNTKTDNKLVLVGGKGWKNEEIYNAIEKHSFKNDIILTGYVTNEELVELYSHSKAFIYPSKYEGFGLPVIEAALCNTPVIVANNSSLREIAPHGELVFETMSSEDLASKMSLIDTQKEIKHNLQQLRIKYNWKSFVAKFIENILSLIKI